MDGSAAERHSLKEIGGIGSPLKVAHGANTEERKHHLNILTLSHICCGLFICLMF